MLQSVLGFLARLSCRSPRMVLVVSTALALLCIFITTQRLQLNANLDDLIAPDRPFMAEYQRFLHEFGDLEYIYVVLAGDDVQRREAAAQHIGTALQALDVVPAAYFAIEPEDQLRIATRAMDDVELRDLAMAADGFAALQQNPAAAVSRAEALLGRLVQSDDANEQESLASSAFLVIEALVEQDLIELPQREYLVSSTGKLHFIRVEPMRDYSTLAVIREPLRQIRAVLDDARPLLPDVEIGLTGKPVLQADEMETSDRDTTRAFILAIILVGLLFMVVIGSVWHPALAVVSLLFAIAWTFGFTTIAIGQLTLLSIVFTLVLVGVGIDFGVHVVSRYKEQRGSEDSKDNTIEAAMVTTLTTAGRGNVTGALTSSLAFYMAMFTEFQGLRELGFIAGTGLLLCLVAMLVVLPSLMVIVDRARERRGSRPPVLPKRTSLQRGAWKVLMARPGTWLLIALALTVAAGPLLRHLDFEKNLLELQAQSLDSVQWERTILADSGESFFGAVIAESKQEVLEIVARAEQQPAVARAGSVFDIIQQPSDEREQWRQQLHQSTHADIDEADQPLQAQDLDGLLQQLSLIVAGARMQQLPEAEYLADLQSRLRNLREQLNDPTIADTARQSMSERLRATSHRINLMLEGDAASLREALPPAVRDMYVSQRGHYLVSLYPVENVWEFEPMERFVAAMRAIDPDATGVPITQYESLIEMLRAFIIAASLAFIAVFLVLWLDLWRLTDAMLAMVPLLVGMAWLLILMSTFGISFNHANFFAVPILIGIGVDSGIHLMHRYREVHPEQISAGSHDAGRPSTFGSTRRAVFMTSMTSLIGFGCLATATHQGLQSLGLVMAIGAATLLIASLFVLPALLAVLERRNPTPQRPTR